MTRAIDKKDKKRFSGAVLIIIGRIVLVLTLFGTGFLAARGANAITLVRPLFFFIVGYCFAIAGVRVASGVWSGSLQVLHQSAAISAVSLIAYLLLGMRSHVVANRSAFWIVNLLSLAMLISWLIRALPRNNKKSWWLGK